MIFVSIFPHGRLLEIPKGRGVFRTKLLKEYTIKLIFPERFFLGGRGGGVQTKPKQPSMGEGRVWILIFWKNIRLHFARAQYSHANTCLCH